MMRCVIILGGEFGIGCFEENKEDFIIACDGGYSHAVKLNLKPDIIIGDMDSINIDTVPPHIAKNIFPTVKDDTDCMLAVKEGISRGYKNFIFLCSFGGRLDHIIANISILAYLDEYDCKGVMYGESDMALMINSQQITLAAVKNSYLSVFSYSDVSSGVCLSGVQYPLNNSTLTSSFPLGVSNRIIDDFATIQVEKGRLLIIISKSFT